MKVRRLSVSGVVATLLVAAVATASPSSAGPPGTWTVISGGGVSTTTEPGMFRNADGTLHVAIQTGNSTNESLAVAHITRGGAFTGRSPVLTGWQSITDDPDLVPGPGGGMRVVFGGLRTSDSDDELSKGYVYYGASNPGGTTWTTAPGQIAVAGTTGYGSYGTGVTTLADGTLVSAYPLNSTVTYQVGTGPVQTFDVAACCVYDMSLATDGGKVYAAWYANGSTAATMGVFVREIYPALGPVQQAPGSYSLFHGSPGTLGTGQAVAMATRAGGGVYLAYNKGYPNTDAVALWRVGTASPRLVPQSKDAGQVALSAGPGGRLWLAFDDKDNNVRAVRTNPAATKFGAVRVLKTPKNTTVYAVGVEGSSGRGDVVYNDGKRIQHQQVLAGLTLKASPGSWKAGKATTVKFTVTDAGDAVKGAKVTAQGKSCTTDKKGVCKISFPKQGPGKIKVAAKKPEYAKAQVKLKVKK